MVGFGRLLKTVGSTVAFVCRVVVVDVVVSVVVQPTTAISQTPKTNGISFFMARALPKLSPPVTLLRRLGFRIRRAKVSSLSISRVTGGEAKVEFLLA